MIEVKKSNNADTRTADGEFSRDTLLKDTYSHITDVRKACDFVRSKIAEQATRHDFTKTAFFEDFYRDMKSGLTDEEFKELPWWKLHLKERHHLNDSVPTDVNMIDVIEMICDCCVAGMARSGEVYDITIPSEVLERAVKNTQDLITKNITIVE